MPGTTRYKITTCTGRVFCGYVQGNGGYLRETHKGLSRLRKMAADSTLIGRQIFEPASGCVAMDTGTSRQVFLEWTWKERMANRVHVPLQGATIEICE